MGQHSGFVALDTGLTARCSATAGDGWRATRQPGVSWRPLHVDERAPGAGGATGKEADATVLIRMEPGSAYPEHEHVGVEEVLILAGGYRDAAGEHRAGSYLRYPPGSRHAPVALGDALAPVSEANPACLLFAVAHGGVRRTAEEPY